MGGFMLANPQGLQIDIYGKIFLLRVGIGLCISLAGYEWRTWTRAKREQTLQAQNDKAMQNLHMHIHASKDTKDNDQKFVLQFVAYLEKFTTNQQSYSRESLLKQQ